MMTTLRTWPESRPIAESLVLLRRKFRLARLLVGTIACLGIAAAWVLLLALTLGYWPDQPPTWLRWAMLLGAGGSMALAAGWILLRTVLWKRNLAQMAREVEQALPDLRNDLINAVLLGREEKPPSESLLRAALQEARQATGKVDLAGSIRWTPLKRWSLATGILALLVGGMALVEPGAMRRGLMAAMPGAYVPHVNDLNLISLTPGDAQLHAGETWTIRAQIDRPLAPNLRAEVIFEDGQRLPMDPGADRTVFSLPMGPAKTSRGYAVSLGNSRWPTDRPWYRLEVWSRARVESFVLRYDTPPYTRQAAPPGVEDPASGPIRCPMGSWVEMELTTSRPVASVVMQRKDAGSLTPLKNSGGLGHKLRFRVDADGAYRLLFRNASGRVFQQMPDPQRMDYFPIEALPDAPPRVGFIEPNRDISAAPGQEVTLRLRASDTYGLSELRLLAEIRLDEQETISQLLDRSFPIEGKEKEEVTFGLKIPEDLPADATANIVYHAVATDNRSLPSLQLGPQTHSSGQFRIVVQDAQLIAARRLQAYQQLRKRLLALLRVQAGLRVDTGICDTRDQIEQIRADGLLLTQGQQAVLSELKDLAQNFDYPADFAAIRQVCTQLATAEAPRALSQAQVLATLESPAQRGESCALLAATQDRIIDSIETLLAILPSLADEKEKPQSREGEDLPPETRQKLRELREQLKEFVEAQKKLVEAGDRLAKKPVDDFTTADQEQLKQLVAAQDKWEKFLNEAFTDLSKMAEQDFSNPSLLKELAAVKTDVTMAKDALAKKAVEIATAIEDNGIENAETLTANLEKWLPDEPDRVKWNMEDPADGQDLTEQPELPTELEDLVGDLLEEEEDLFEEMEDMTGKYNMSGDKGIGWDAMDGPISSMNAQGVTGNQLPNKNEMSGRSGEGRQGKSSGEYVEDKSVGKGGRRTPTRLTADPFQKGQIDNQSKEPAGGATGGGKVSGAGQEGLEGPVPPQMQKQMQRLAGRQAELIHRAEKHRARYSPTDYRNFELGRTIELMRRLHDDMKDHRYRNALRSRDRVMGSLRQTSLLLTGKVHVSTDTSASMPKYLREMSSTNDPDQNDPARYRQALRSYYRRLSELDK